MKASNDKVTFFLAAFVALAAITDFLLGSVGRRRVKEKLEGWWFVVAELPYVGLAQRAIGRISAAFHRCFGKPFISVRFWVVTGVSSFALTLAASGAAFSWYRNGLSFFDSCMIVLREFVGLGALETPLFVGNLLGHGLGMGITLTLLGRMTSESRTGAFSRLFILNGVLAIAAVYVVLALVSFFVAVYSPVWKALLYSFLYAPFVCVKGACTGKYVYLAVSIPALAAIIPFALSVLVIGSFFLLKLATPVIRTLLLTLIERSVEAEKGAVTLIATALAGLIKLLQLALSPPS